MTVPDRYTRTAMVFHWLIAVLIIANVILGLTAESFPETSIRMAFDTHKSIGLTVLGLVIMRILWRLTHKPPPLPASYARWEQRLSGVAHAALYALMLAIPISGWLHDSAWKGAETNPLTIFYIIPWFRIPAIENADPVAKEAYHKAFGEVHELLGFALIALFVLHVGGALKHEFIDKHKELRRIAS